MGGLSPPVRSYGRRQTCSPGLTAAGRSITFNQALFHRFAVASEARGRWRRRGLADANLMDESHSAIVRFCVDDLRARDDLGAPYGLGSGKRPLGRSKQFLRKA